MLSKYFQGKQWLILILLSTFFIGTANAAVRSLMAEEYVQYSADEIYWEIKVNCSASSSPRVIQQKAGGDQWCSKDFTGTCGKTKMKAAGKICSAAFNKRLSELKELEEIKQVEKKALRDAEEAKQEKAKAEKERLAKEKAAADAEDPLMIEKNQISIEDRRIKIEQQQLDLRREALGLQKQELELKLKLRERQ